MKASLALLALFGLGLGTTAALWSDNVWFKASVTTANFDLQGSVTSASTGFVDSATGSPVSDITLEIPNTVWAALEPGDEVDTTVWIKNAGTVTAVLDAPVFALGEVTNGLAIQDSPTTGISVSAAGISAGTTLAPDDVIPVIVTIDAGADLVQNASGTLTIHFSGENQQ